MNPSHYSIPGLIGVSVLAIIPSLAWLFYYLGKDDHPEPKSVIIKLFLAGFLLPPFVGIVEKAIQEWIVFFGASSLTLSFLVGAALLEEVAKYLVALVIFYHNKEFDEPIDAMIYLIVVALGFAASENIIITLATALEDPASSLLALLFLRFVGATFLHTLASGAIGYFIARGYFLKERFSLLKGLGLATFIHTFFNFFILKSSVTPPKPEFILLIIGLLLGSLVFILGDFRALKKYGVSRFTLS